MIFLIPVIGLFNYLLGLLFLGYDSLMQTRFIYFILWGIPSLYMGIYVFNKDRIKYISKSMDIVMLILSISTIINTLDSLITGGRVSVGGSTYQDASYMAAFAFGINLYYIFYGNNHDRFKFTRNKQYKIMCILLLVVQIIGVLASGGRGGLILIASYIIYISFSILYSKDKTNILKYILLFVSASILFFILYKKFNRYTNI